MNSQKPVSPSIKEIKECPTCLTEEEKKEVEESSKELLPRLKELLEKRGN